MNRYTAMFLATVAAALLIIAPAGAQKNSGAAAALEAAKQKETQKGDLNGAIKQYGEIADKYAKTDRAVAALALLRMAEAYARLDDAKSRLTYERIVKDYADQKEATTLAQTRLGGMDPSGGPVSRTVWSPPPASPLVGIAFPRGTLSRDGRFFSYSSNRPGQGDIIIHEIATGADRKVTNQSVAPGTAEESVISPDGKRIAYIWSGKGEKGYSVQIANLTGDQNPRQLYSSSPDVYNVFLQDWSPDGQWLAIEIHHLDATVQIGLLPVSGGSPRILKSVEWSANSSEKAMYGTYFSRDGKYLAYDLAKSNASEERNVYVIAVDGSREIPVVEQPGSNEVVGWSPDGKWILFKSDRSGTFDLWAIASTDGKPQGRPQRLRANVGASFHPIGWAPSGALYYRTSSSGSGTSKVQLASLDFATGKFLSTPIFPNRGYQENTSQPKWSPDNNRLAYRSEMRDESGNDELIIRTADTGAVRELRPKQLRSIISTGAWEPNGRSLLISGMDFQNRSGIFRVDAETGDAAVLILDQPDTRLNFGAWMPDGLSFWARSLGGVNRVNPQTGEISSLLPEGPQEFLGLSPNGETVYYRRPYGVTKKDPASPFAGRAAETAILARDLATGNEKELGRQPPLGTIRFSPDTQFFTATSTDAASNSRILLLISTSGGPTRELLRVPAGVKPEDLSNTRLGQSIDVVWWAPDSRSLVLRKNFNNSKQDDELQLISLEGQELGKVPVPRGLGDISLSPDHRYAVYTTTEPAPPATTEVSVLENFLPKTTATSKK